jgi:hypothetical protein
MGDWKSLLRKERSDWLLEASDPSIRYWALKWLFDRDAADPELIASRDAVSDSLPVRKLLAAQRPEGYWGSDTEAHAGTRGELHLLLWLGYEGGPGDGARKAADYLAAGCLDENGAYRYRAAESRRDILLPCHGAELGRFMLRFGLARDPRLGKLVDWLLSLRREDGAWPCPSKAAAPSCLFATALFMRLAEDIGDCRDGPRLGARREGSIREAAAAAAELFLSEGFARAARNKPSGRWYGFGFPLQWESDVLELLRLVAPYSGLEDPRVAEALELVLSKQRDDGTWPCEKEPKGGRWMRRYIELDTPGANSKWVTLAAYRALKALAH